MNNKMYQYDEVIHTGNASQRKKKKYHNQRDNKEIIKCYRCGAIVNKYPWSEDDTLCKECNELLDDMYNKIPWKIRK